MKAALAGSQRPSYPKRHTAAIAPGTRTGSVIGTDSSVRSGKPIRAVAVISAGGKQVDFVVDACALFKPSTPGRFRGCTAKPWDVAVPERVDRAGSIRIPRRRSFRRR